MPPRSLEYRVKTERFFRWVWRFNALAIAGAALVGVLIAAVCALHIARTFLSVGRHIASGDVAPMRDKISRPPNTPEGRVLDVGTFSLIRGTTMLAAPISVRTTSDYFRYSSGSSDSYPGSLTHNWVFYDYANGESRSLLPSDDGVILETRELRADTGPADSAPKALMYLLAEQDTNQDGTLSHADRTVIALARADGKDLIRFPDVPGNVLAKQLSADASKLIVMTNWDGKIQATHIDLATFKVTRTDTLRR